MSDQTLEHATDDCTGEWVLDGRRLAGVWRCPVCGVSYPSTPENDAARDRAFAYGVLLRNQARRGRLEGRLPDPDPPMMIELPKPDDDDE